MFTHFLLAGLRGAADSDGDGQVSIDELYRHVYRRTLRRTGTGSALQHPTLTTHPSGAGELVVSRPVAAAAALQLPAGAERYLIFALPSATVMGELSGDTARTLALPAGRYLIERPAGLRSSVAEIDLSGGAAARCLPTALPRSPAKSSGPVAAGLSYTRCDSMPSSVARSRPRAPRVQRCARVSQPRRNVPLCL